MIAIINRTRLRKWECIITGKKYIQGYYKDYHWVFLHNISVIKNRIVIQITHVKTGKQTTFESLLIGLISEIAEKGINDRFYQ